MLKIYQTILSLYKEKFTASTTEFKAGFELCLSFLEQGIRTSTQFNLNVLTFNQGREIEKLKAINEQQRKEYFLVLSELNKKSLIVDKPIGHFKSYEFVTNNETKEAFTIIINANRETVMVFWFNFLAKNNYKTAEEAKSKFLTFLLKFSSRGFIAYKNIKVYNKEKFNDDSK